MILFSLRCAADHPFEAWFPDGASYDAQAARGDIACPVCGETRIEKAIMAPSLNRKGCGAALDAPDLARAMRAALGELRRNVEKTCDYVGERFPEEARRIHYGETEPRPIYGEATADEAKALDEEGVAVKTIPWIDDGN